MEFQALLNLHTGKTAYLSSLWISTSLLSIRLSGITLLLRRPYRFWRKIKFAFLERISSRSSSRHPGSNLSTRPYDRHIFIPRSATSVLTKVCHKENLSVSSELLTLLFRTRYSWKRLWKFIMKCTLVLHFRVSQLQNLLLHNGAKIGAVQ